MNSLIFLTNKCCFPSQILKIILITFLGMCSLKGVATNYFINSLIGDDSNVGSSIEAPWKSFINMEKNIFKPGDSILFAKGTSYTGGFVFHCSGSENNPITFSNYSTPPEVIIKNTRKELSPLLIKYGAGQLPAFSNPDWKILNGNIFRIEGNYITIDGLYFHDNANPPGSNPKNKNVQKLGAIYLSLGTHHDTIKNCEFENTPVSIKIKGDNNLITRNYFHDSFRPMAESWGPIAIMIVSSYNEISYNRFTNYGSYGGPYGSDGGVVELDGVDDDFNAHDIHIHHNTSINNHGFLEIAARNVENITVAYNLSDDRNQFIGGGSMKVKVYNNTVIRTREPNVDRFVFWTFDPKGTCMDLRNNIFYISKDLQVFGPVVEQIGHVRVAIGEQSRKNNLYYSPGNPDPIGISKKNDDFILDPLFLDTENHNFRLQKDSPARGKGSYIGYDSDLDQYPVFPKEWVDLGAYTF